MGTCRLFSCILQTCLFHFMILCLIISNCNSTLTVDSFSFTPQIVDTNAEYTLQFHSSNLSWIQSTQIIISFDSDLYNIVNGQAYTCSSTTQLGTNPVEIAPAPVCTGIVVDKKKTIRVTDWLVSQYAFNTVVTIVISGIPNPHCTRRITGIHFQVLTIVNNIPIDSGNTDSFSAVKNTITTPSLLFSTNKRFEVGTLTLTFTTSTTVFEKDMILVQFPYGVEIMYDFTCNNITGFTGSLICNKLDEGVILIENGFSGSSQISSQQFSLSLTGVLGYLDEPATDSILIFTLDAKFHTVIDSTLGTEPELQIQFEDVKTRVLCDDEMCGANTSDAEKQALIDFYTSTGGSSWLINTNWLSGDPCINSWYGIMCNKYGQIISIHMFENTLTGTIPDSISDLKYLLTFNIFNDERTYEGIDKPNKNTITTWNPKIHTLKYLEEINFTNLNMNGTLDTTFGNLQRLRAINLSSNIMSGDLPDVFDKMPNLEIIQIPGNQFSGNIPPTLIALQNLKFVEMNDNLFTGTIPIIQSQQITGVEFSSNQFSGDFPTDYFSTSNYLKLKFVNVNLNNITMPDHCLRYVYCFKNTLIDTVDGNSITSIDTNTVDIINSADDAIVYDVVEF